MICTGVYIWRNNSFKITLLNNTFCSKTVRGLGECVMRWMIDFARFIEVSEISLNDEAEIQMNDGTTMPYRLLRLKKCIDENIEIPLLWEDLSYYRRFGFEDALEPKKQINPLLIEEYFKNPDIYFRARCLMVLRLEREIVSSRQFKEYLRNWQVQAFLTSCFHYDETQDYSMFYNTSTVT